LNDRDELRVFRPRMGKGTRSSGGAHASLRNALLSRIRGAGRSAVRRAQARSRIAVGQPGPDALRVVIKAYIARLTATGAKAASLHRRSIQRDGIEKDGSPGVLYDASGAVRSEAFEQPRIDEGDTVFEGSENAAFDIADTSGTEVLIEVDEELSGRLAPELEVLVRGAGDAPLGVGRVERVSGGVSRRTIDVEDARVRATGGVVRVWAKWERLEPGISPRIGQRVDAVVELPRARNPPASSSELRWILLTTRPEQASSIASPGPTHGSWW
jgi:hypothetical protein